MKKLLIIIMCIQIVNLPVLADELINDQLVEMTLQNKNLTINSYKQNLIEDSFAETTLKNKQNQSEKAQTPIIDVFVEKTLPNKNLALEVNQPSVINDILAEKTLKNCTPLVVKKNNFDFDLIKRVPIKISIIEPITTKRGLQEGQELNFKVLSDVKISNGTTIKKDSIVSAKLETISLNQAFGVPADIIIDDFKAKTSNDANINLDGEIHKIGANRSLWVYPAGYMGCFFFGAGLLVFPIRGGHAKLQRKDVYEVYLPSSN